MFNFTGNFFKKGNLSHPKVLVLSVIKLAFWDMFIICK